MGHVKRLLYFSSNRGGNKRNGTRLHLNGTKVIVTHKLNLELLKRINDNDYVVPIKASPYSVSTSFDFSLNLLER
ncbi:MAG TPA: hypothetical protein VFY68_16795 [Nitrososphaeraceae archaeon]|nr:hypothetical protein [Nitrososphaeraceae archaeon]